MRNSSTEWIRKKKKRMMKKTWEISSQKRFYKILLLSAYSERLIRTSMKWNGLFVQITGGFSPTSKAVRKTVRPHSMISENKKSSNSILTPISKQTIILQNYFSFSTTTSFVFFCHLLTVFILFLLYAPSCSNFTGPLTKLSGKTLVSNIKCSC